jgi:hypothetical protein
MTQQQKVYIRNGVLIGMIVFAAAMRLVSFKYPVLSNFTPVGAMALFGGAYFTDKWKAYLVPLVALFISDIAINSMYAHKLVLWSSSSIFVYACFLLMTFVGTLMEKVNIVNLGIASLVTTTIHWLVIDLPWLYGDLYPHTINGYIQSLMAALPFERNMLLGDLIYGIILFGGFELAKWRFTELQPAPVRVKR